MQIIDNFESSYHKFLDARQKWDSLAELKSNTNILMPDGFQAYCNEEKQWYQLAAENEDDPSTYKWEPITDEEAKAIAATALAEAEKANASASAALALAAELGNSASLTETITSNTEVGGIERGDTIQNGTSITNVLKQILIKYIAPSINFTADKVLLNKKGTVITAPINLSASFTKGTEDIVSTEIKIGNDILASSDTSDFSLNYEYETDIISDTSFVTNVTDSKKTTSKELKFEFVNPYYYGVSDTNEISDFTGLTENIMKKNNSKTVSYTSDAKYLVFAYDSNYGNLTSIKDKNNFENLSAFVKNTIEIDGEEYNVYISADKVVCSDFEYTFKI